MSSSESTYETCLKSLAVNGNEEAPSTDALLQCITTTFDAQINNTNDSIDAFFLLYAASLVFFMQAGFAMLCAGCVRINNVQNTLLKNMLDACGASLGFYTVGYAFAFGGSFDDEYGKSFIGSENFFLMGVENDSFWLFQFAFCATSATIVAGTLAERCQMTAYLAYSIMLSAFVYPVVVRSIWSKSGFLSAVAADPLWGVGMVDFAGSTVVHITGGMTALIATMILGPRTGRFYDLRGKPLAEPKEMPGKCMCVPSFVLKCTFILWFGWYGFNSGSIISLSLQDNYLVLSHTAVNTTLSAAAGCIAALFLSTIISERFTGEISFNLQYAMNGCLSGLVSVTASCSVVTSWAAIIIGFLGGMLYIGVSKLLVKRRIDDAVDAVPVHLASGIWGSIAAGLFATPKWMEQVYDNPEAGLFYGGGHLLACQSVGVLFILATWAVEARFEPTGTVLKSEREGRIKWTNISQNMKRGREKECTYFRKIGKNNTLPASSVHSRSLHGTSYHGRKITDIDSVNVERAVSKASNSLDEAHGVEAGSPFTVGSSPLAPRRANSNGDSGDGV
ncbi:hypothetical protein THAOC_36477 [Thalassiosira oceanica]|uniref:Ammonium transporter AmtB-like domain-containing protein n=1 Tax=Thalassiosira oceanica TaxID=159749 RepID=K0REG8_THAOC|nr:hypothetical protein THAOC_36477 [Thalassiosira oceanica]|eukprot:EJK44947.1 hypothetical protein THAOC_36477 [Thalassiosira oceanica]